MSNCQMLCRLVRYYVILSDNNVSLSDNDVDWSNLYVVICMALTGQEHVFMIYFLTND